MLTAPIAVTQRMPMRSASQPISMPPSPAPIQPAELASATAERDAPRSAAIGFNATTMISGEP
jgi:hypothetical protein